MQQHANAACANTLHVKSHVARYKQVIIPYNPSCNCGAWIVSIQISVTAQHHHVMFVYQKQQCHELPPADLSSAQIGSFMLLTCHTASP